MGLYATLVDLEMNCPRCNTYQYIRMQTKDIPDIMGTFFIQSSLPKSKERIMLCSSSVAKVSPDLRYVNAILECASPACLALSRMKQLAYNEYISGGGLLWKIQYNVQKSDGIILGPAKILESIPNNETKTESEIITDYLNKIEELKTNGNKKYTSEKFTEIWNKILQISFNDPILAVLYLHI